MNKRAIFSKSLLTSGHDFPKLAPVPARQERQFGEVSEWLKEHAWKVCIRQRIGGSNPPSPPYLKKSPYESTGFFFVYCTHRVPPPTSVRARGNCAHQLSGYSVNNQNAQDSREHICVIWSLPVTSSLIKMPPTEIHVTCHHKIVMPEASTMEKIVN